MPLDSLNNCEAWEIDTTMGCWDVPDTTPAATVLKWRQFATAYLWAMTGRRLGPSCPTTVRPCKRSCFEGYGYGRFLNQGQYNGLQSTGGWIPYIGADGEFRNATLCGCPTSGCHCGPELCEIELPGPVYDIVEVTIDGVVVDSSTYAVYDARFLTRVTNGPDPALCWPTCQDMTRSTAQENTFAVTYRTGLSLSGLATVAVTQLTAHFIRGCGGGCGCGAGTRQNLQRLQRQGVELEFADPQQLFDDGRTGIQAVDMFIRAANPYGLASPLRVLSPDGPQRPRLWGGIV